MTILVTGGAGYIGSITVRLLRERGYDTVVLDTMEFGNRAAIGDAPLVVGDIRDQALVERVSAEHDVDAVIHFAGYKNPGESMRMPERYFDNNVSATLALLHSAQRAGVRYFVFSSSCSVYGTPSTLPVAESNALHPESPYGESKLMVEQMLRWFDTCYGLRYASLRYFNASGAWPDASLGEDWRRTQNLVPLVMKAALGRAPAIKVFGTDYPTPDGTAIRDYIHVVDLADAHIRALEYVRAADRSTILNLGTGRGSSVKEVYDTAVRISGVDIPVEYTARRPGDPVAVFADNRLAREQLGWEPRFGMEEIIEHAWRWHSSRPDGYTETINGER